MRSPRAQRRPRSPSEPKASEEDEADLSGLLAEVGGAVAKSRRAGRALRRTLRPSADPVVGPRRPWRRAA